MTVLDRNEWPSMIPLVQGPWYLDPREDEVERCYLALNHKWALAAFRIPPPLDWGILAEPGEVWTRSREGLLFAAEVVAASCDRAKLVKLAVDQWCEPDGKRIAARRAVEAEIGVPHWTIYQWESDNKIPGEKVVIDLLRRARLRLLSKTKEADS